MLLVALTGPVGSSKSTILARFAENVRDSGKLVDGFIAEAGPRLEENRGALSYTLRWVATRKTDLLATREPSEPYEINKEVFEKVRSWAENLIQVPPADLIVLDEFGKWEADGEGHMPIWPSVRDARPRMVVIAVREDSLSKIETRLGQKFDAVLNTSEPDVEPRLGTMFVELSDWERVGVFGAGSGGVEWSVGSWLHTIRFPFVGMVMSSTQSVVMSIAADEMARKERVVWVSFISAGLKALSPSGSRIGPMIAISSQGLLFSVVTRSLGWNRLGIFLGAFLVGIWAGLQGFFFQFLLIGTKNLAKAYDSAAVWLNGHLHLPTPSFIALLITIILLDGIVAGFATTFVWARRSRYRVRIAQLMDRPAEKGGMTKRTVWRDLTRPMFLLPIVLVAVIFWLSGSGAKEVAWMVFRAIAVAFVVFSAARFIDPAGFLRWLQKRGHWGPAYALRRALEKQNGMTSPDVHG